MRQNFYIATFDDDAIAVTKEYNLNIEFNHLCISENLDEDKIQGTIDEMKKDWQESEASKAIIHGPFTELCPASIDQRVVAIAFDRLNEAYFVCKKLGVERMVVHSGYLPLIYFKEWHEEKSVNFWKKFMADKPEGFRIFIENVFEDEPLMMKQMLDKINDSRIKVCLDIGHANAVMEEGLTVFDWINTLGEHIGHFHIHNNFGKKDLHNDISNGSMDMIKIFETIKNKCDTDVTFTIESRDCRSSVEWLIENKYI
ncbi:MAG: sugar phosphate isomerase/epimerase [Anaerovoracaceae bacterium]